MIGKRILVAEEDSITALQIQTDLEKMNYEVVATVDSGEEVIRVVQEQSVDLVLVDQKLATSMTGTEVAHWIVNTARIPAVIFTGEYNHDLIQRAQQSGITGFIVEPFTNQQLHATIEMALHNDRQAQAAQQQFNDKEAEFHRQAQAAQQQFNDKEAEFHRQAQAAQQQFNLSRARERLLRFSKKMHTTAEAQNEISQIFNQLFDCDRVVLYQPAPDGALKAVAGTGHPPLTTPAEGQTHEETMIVQKALASGEIQVNGPEVALPVVQEQLQAVLYARSLALAKGLKDGTHEQRQIMCEEIGRVLQAALSAEDLDQVIDSIDELYSLK